MGRISAALMIISTLFITQQAPKDLTDWFQMVRQPYEKVTTIEFYARPGGPDGNQVAVANAGNLTFPPNLFGLVNIADYTLTTGPSPTSALVGRGQGFFTSSSMNDFSLFTALNIIFQTGKYKGSTLTIIGYDPTAIDRRELIVIGGSGAFRLARGTVVFDEYNGDPTLPYPTVKLSVTLLHYQFIKDSSI